MSDATNLFIHEALSRVRSQAMYPEYLDRPGSTELRFPVSSHDLLQNVIRSRRAKQALKLGRIGYPFHRDDDIEVVSHPESVPFARLNSLQFSILNQSGMIENRFALSTGAEIPLLHLDGGYLSPGNTVGVPVSGRNAPHLDVLQRLRTNTWA